MRVGAGLPCRPMRLPVVLVALLVGLAPAVGALDLEARRMLNASESAPWKAVGRVNVATMDSTGMCTGTLIAPDLVITAAHCLIDQRTGAVFAPGNVNFVAGWRLGQQAAHRKAAAIALHPDYDHLDRLNIDQIGRDLALIKLESEIPPDVVPFFRIGTAPPPATPLTLISYRRDRAHALTRQDGCQVLGTREAVMALGCAIVEGVSGSPLFAGTDGEERVVAVISAMSARAGQDIAFAVRVDAAIGELLAILP